MLQPPAFLTRLSGVPRLLLKGVLTLGSAFLLVVMIVFLATIGGTMWLSSTSSGQTFLSKQLSLLTAESGYSIEVGAIRARGAGSVMIDRISIGKGDAPVTDLTKITVTPSLAALFAGHANISLQVRHMVVHPSPTESAAATVQTPPSGPVIPAALTLARLIEAIPFSAINLDRLQIDQIAFVDAAGVAQQDPLSVVFDMNFKRDKSRPTFSAALVIDGLLEEQPLTALLVSHAELGGDTPAYFIERLDIQAGAIQQSFTGRLNLPVNDADQRALPLWLTTRFGDQPASLTADIIQHGELGIRNMVLSGPGLAATGEIAQSPDGVWQGALKTDISFAALAAAWPPAVDIPLRETLQAEMSFADDSLSVAIPRLAYALVDLREVTLSVTPTPARPDAYSLALALKEAGSDAALQLSAALLKDDTGLWMAENIDARLIAGKAGAVTLTGRAAQQNMDVRIVTDTLRLDRLRGILAPPAGTPALQLSKADILVQGPATQPIIDWSLRLTPTALPKGAPNLYADAKGRIAEGMAILTADLVSKALREGRITAQQPLRLSLSPFIFEVPDNGLQATGRLQGNISTLNGFLPLGTRLSGPLDISVTATGSLSAPTTSGSLRWQKGSATEGSSGLTLQGIDVVARFDQGRIVVDSLTARDKGRGRLFASGSLGLATGVWPADMTMKLENIDPFQNTVAAADMPVVDGVFSADLALTGARNNYLLSGKVGSERLTIQLPEQFSSSVPQLNIVEKRRAKKSSVPGADALRLDISAAMPQRIFVRGWGLDAEFGGALTIAGTAANPLVTGMLQSIRGRFEEFGRRFELTRARLDFRGAMPPSPFLDIVADTRVDGYDASVILSGSANTPKISFASTPSLPPEDVLSHILFGQDRADISPTQAIQLAQTLRRFSGAGGGLDPLGALRSGIGLDDLSVDSGEGGASVGAGKYLADDVYLELNSGNATTTGGAKLKIDLTPNIKAESKIGGDSQAGGGLFWEWEY